MHVPIDWLKQKNREFRDAGVDPKRRPWEALSRYSIEFRSKFSLDSPIAEEIFEYFKTNSKSGAHHVGSLYDSVYFYDAAFWVVSIPIMYGTVQLDSSKSLREMPEQIKRELLSTPETAWDFVVFWADCVDYGLGISELSAQSVLDPFGRQLLMAADQELRSAISQLKENRPNERALMTCRMATEIFLKAYIALKVGLTEKQAREFGHNLDKLFDRFLECSGYLNWEVARNKLEVFPSVQDRYSEQSHPAANLWTGFALAQSIGTLIVREKSGRNTISQIRPSKDQ